MRFRVNMSVDVEARSSSEAEQKALSGDYSGAFVGSVDQSAEEVSGRPKRGPACGHSVCSQNYIDTGDRSCVRECDHAVCGLRGTGECTKSAGQYDDEEDANEEG